MLKFGWILHAPDGDLLSRFSLCAARRGGDLCDGAVFVLLSRRICAQLSVELASCGEEHRGLIAYACWLVYLLFLLLFSFRFAETISVITNDGRNIVGVLKGFDQATNMILDESHERVYSTKVSLDNERTYGRNLKLS
ncbi:putative U6 snRNA-associated Sm-like protein Lsm1/8 [Dioscorea sansibarensis]